ncbi:MAG: response regulator [Oscillospiraceae bacterium]|nr:response regulator [Oscillospiraceae bacterium]
MNIKGRLLEIPGLVISEKIEKMDPNKLNAYLQSLNAFVENISGLREQVEESIKSQEYGLLIRSLTDVRDMLLDIYAGPLALSCQEQIDILQKKEKNSQEIEDAVDILTGSILTLSIDLQMLAIDVKKDEAERREREEKEKAEVLEDDGDVKSILAVDDRAFFLDILKETLRDTAYKLTCVNSSKTALLFLKSNSPDLFILDIDMPDMDGFELAGKIREGGHKAPIIFLTSNDKRSYVIKAIESGGSDFIVKPFDKEQVIARIKKHIIKHTVKKD